MPRLVIMPPGRDAAFQVPVSSGDVGSAAAPPDCSLKPAEFGFDQRANNVHDGAAKDSSERGWELQGSLPVYSDGVKFLWYPEQQVLIRPKDLSDGV